MDPSGRKGVFVGYSESAKAYRIYIPGQRKIELSRDVTFEDICYQRSRHAKSDSDEQEAPQEVLSSPSPAVERVSMEEDYSAPPADLVDSVIPKMSLRWIRKGSLHGFERHCRMLRAMQLPEGQLERERDLKDLVAMLC